MDKEHNKIFEKVPAIKNNEEYYEKMVYKLLPGPNKMLPKVFFSEKGKEKYNPSDELLKKYEEGTHKKGDNFDLKDCHNLINFFKKSLMNEEWKTFDFEFSDTSEYEDISGFYKKLKAKV
jgi:CRISPR-associated protein Cpf1